MHTHTRTHARAHTHTHTYIYVYIYIEREREREREREITKEVKFYLTTHSTHFIHDYMVKDYPYNDRGNPLPLRKGENILLNDTFNTFYLRPYDVEYNMAK